MNISSRVRALALLKKRLKMRRVMTRTVVIEATVAVRMQ